MCSKLKPAALESEKDEAGKAERRIEVERRQYLYSVHIPERRSGKKRRNELETSKPSNDRKNRGIDN
jgi:hypothetical protein